VARGNPPDIGAYEFSSAIGVYRPGNHTFYLDFNGNGKWDGAAIDRQFRFGISGDTPITGDWSGTGKTRIGVYRPGNQTFYLDFNGNGQWDGAVIDRQFRFGISGDVPITGDWDGDGKTEIGVYRPSNRFFCLDLNGNGQWDGPAIDGSFLFGNPGDTGIAGDWTSSGKTKIGVFRSSHTNFWLDWNANNQWDGTTIDRAVSFGATSDRALAGQWF
jgi:hypothetical protein